MSFMDRKAEREYAEGAMLLCQHMTPKSDCRICELERRLRMTEMLLGLWYELHAPFPPDALTDDTLAYFSANPKGAPIVDKAVKCGGCGHLAFNHHNGGACKIAECYCDGIPF